MVNVNTIRNARDLEGTYPAIITPMHDNGEINYDSLYRLIDEQIQSGVNGIVACGTTGQSAGLRNSEHVDLAQNIFNHINGRTQFIVGAGSNDTTQSIELMDEIRERIGESTFLLTTGYYNKPTMKGVQQHYEKISETFPNSNIILYNVPGRTNVNYTPEMVIELSNRENIIAIKEASGDLDQVEQIIQNTNPDNFRVLSGEDNLVARIMQMGGFGVISATGNVAPALYTRLTQAALSGNYELANELQERVNPLVDAMFTITNPIPLAHVFGTNLRLPLCRHEEIQESIDNTLRNYSREELGVDYNSYRD